MNKLLLIVSNAKFMNLDSHAHCLFGVRERTGTLFHGFSRKQYIDAEKIVRSIEGLEESNQTIGRHVDRLLVAQSSVHGRKDGW